MACITPHSLTPYSSPHPGRPTGVPQLLTKKVFLISTKSVSTIGLGDLFLLPFYAASVGKSGTVSSACNRLDDWQTVHSQALGSDMEPQGKLDGGDKIDKDLANRPQQQYAAFYFGEGDCSAALTACMHISGGREGTLGP